MKYERMWFSLKNIVKEEYEMYAGGKVPLGSYSEGQFDEADYILGEMDCLEVREALRDAKEKAEHRL